ncbi:hypothetical protein H0H93_016245 [Arthromyces matolae]|nr:hypothetical protein H0H93_016245 [Arthromyces matolae]
MSRQSSPDQPVANTSSPGSSPIAQGDLSEQPSSSSRRRMSKDSEGYPSWLPRRPAPPAPTSTFQSSVGLAETAPSEISQFVGGRKPTPRSVRIVSLQNARREPTDQTRVANSSRAWSKATGAPVAPALFSSSGPSPRVPQPKFHSRTVNLDLLRNPTLRFHFYFYLWPLLVFAHIPLQTFFDFNAVYILFQVSKHPNPQAPGVPGSGRNWSLGAAAYIACWLAWILVVFVVYELIYSFIRRWRVKRPLMIPIYLSSSSFNLVAMTSYTNFCFLQHNRFSAFLGEHGSIRDGLAETFWFYSQNLPTVALLLPRAGLALALLLTFSTPQVGEVALTDAGIHPRDSTFFRTTDGTLTNYARGVLIANAAWTAWRALVLIASWIGLWIVSGQGCAGICGPRYRWEEEDMEKRQSYYSDNASLEDTLPWSWRECTRMRIQDAYDFCLTVRPTLRWNDKKDHADGTQVNTDGIDEEISDGMEQVLAAIGFPSLPPPARRPVLSGDLFEGPHDEHPADLSDIIPKVAKRSSKDKIAGPSLSFPYPFTAAGARVSSTDKVPFPPSPVPSGSKKATTRSSGTGTGTGTGTGSGSGTGSSEEEDEDDEEEEEDEDEEDEDDDEDDDGASEEPSTGRASGSMSSLGHPVSSRYPFSFRRPGHGRGNSVSSGAASHQTPVSHTRSVQSGVSHATQSTGNRESSDSHSPRSQHSTSDAGMSMSGSSGIPMPPRHPQQGQRRGRQRAGTVPVVTTTSSPVVFPTTSRPKAHVRTDSDLLGPGVGSDEGHSLLDEDVGSEESHEAAERDDLVGLLSSPSAATSRTSLRNRGSIISQHRSRSNSRTNSHTSSSSRSRPTSIAISVRSRAQSLMQNIGAASHSSLELVQTAMRSRANSSMARLEEDSFSSDGRTHSRSGSGSVSANENYTFGQPMRMNFPLHNQERVEEEPGTPEPESQPHTPPLPLQHSLSNLSFTGPPPQRFPPPSPVQSRRSRPSSTDPTEATATERAVSISGTEGDFLTPGPSSPVEIPIRDIASVTESATSSHPDISTAPQSFVTAPGTVESTTESSGRTIASWGDFSHMVDRPDATWRPA